MEFLLDAPSRRSILLPMKRFEAVAFIVLIAATSTVHIDAQGSARSERPAESKAHGHVSHAQLIEAVDEEYPGADAAEKERTKRALGLGEESATERVARNVVGGRRPEAAGLQPPRDLLQRVEARTEDRVVWFRR